MSYSRRATITSIEHPVYPSTKQYPCYLFKEKECGKCKRKGMLHIGFNDQRKAFFMTEDGRIERGIIWHVLKCYSCGVVNIIPDTTPEEGEFVDAKREDE